VSLVVTRAIALRVLWQIRRDPRTIALLLIVPVVLLVLLKWVFAGEPSVFLSIGVPLCGLFPFIVMFLITSIAMLRERTTGTLERLMSLPLSKPALLGGYALAFGVLATIQAAVVCTVGFTLLGLDATHKGPEEGARPWPEEIRMSDEVKALVDRRWSEYGIDANAANLDGTRRTPTGLFSAATRRD